MSAFGMSGVNYILQGGLSAGKFISKTLACHIKGLRKRYSDLFHKNMHKTVNRLDQNRSNIQSMSPDAIPLFWKEVLGLTLFATAYWLMGRVGLLLTEQPEGVASIWPVSGLALAVLLLNPRRRWKKLLAIIFFMNTAANWSGGNSLPVSLGFGLANTLEPFLGAWVLEYFCKSNLTFERAVEVTVLLGVAVLSNAITALLGATVSTLAFGAPLIRTWLLWWAADGLGILLVTPVIVYWANNPTLIRSASVGKMIEGALLTFALTLFALLLFGPFTHAENPVLRNYMLFPLLIWLAFRFTSREMAYSLLLFAAIAVWYTLHGYGIFSFADQTRTEHLISLQMYLSVAVFSGLLLSAMVSERKRAEEVLRVAESKYRAIFENTRLGIFQSTLQGKVISVNPAFARMFGYDSPEDVAHSTKNVGTDIFVDPNRRTEMIRLMTENPNLQIFENLYHRKDGSPFIGRLNTFPITDSDGGLLRIEGIIEDITERKQTEEALHASEEKYRTVADFTFDWEAWRAPDGAYIYVSPSCERITGYKVEEFLADSELMTKITHPDDRGIINAHFYAIAHQPQENNYHLDFRIVARGGEVRWIGHSCTSVYGDNGEWLGRRESNRDITTRKKSEAVLRSRLWLSQFADTHSIDELLQSTINETEALTDSQLGFFYILDADQKNLTLQMCSTNTLQNICAVRGKEQHYSIDKAGVWADCIYKREPIIYNDYNGLPHRKDLPVGHAPISRILVMPIMRNDLVVAIFGVGNKPKNYDEQDIKVVSQIADLAWDIILRKRSEEEVRNTKDKLEIANRDLKTALDREKELSHTDSLTGINNRRYLFELATRAFDIAFRHRQPLAVMMFDIDHFKNVNDTYGHDIGDRVLQQVVQAACSELRSSDVIGRYGGEEFVVILPMTTAQQADAVAGRIRASVEALHIPTSRGAAEATLSVGIAELIHAPHKRDVYSRGESETLDDLIRYADEAMYVAKRAGRNRVAVFGWE